MTNKHVVVYRCKCCGNEYESRAELVRGCGRTKEIVKHFRPGELVRWQKRKVLEIRAIRDGFLSLYPNKSYLVAFGYDQRSYGGPIHLMEDQFCANSMEKVDMKMLESQLILRRKQVRAAETLCKQVGCE